MHAMYLILSSPICSSLFVCLTKGLDHVHAAHHCAKPGGGRLCLDQSNAPV